MKDKLDAVGARPEKREICKEDNDMEVPILDLVNYGISIEMQYDIHKMVAAYCVEETIENWIKCHNIAKWIM